MKVIAQECRVRRSTVRKHVKLLKAVTILCNPQEETS